MNRLMAVIRESYYKKLGNWYSKKCIILSGRTLHYLYTAIGGRELTNGGRSTHQRIGVP